MTEVIKMPVHLTKKYREATTNTTPTEKKKVYIILDWHGRVEDVFLTKVSAQGFIARYKNTTPHGVSNKYSTKYRIVIGTVVYDD